MVQIANILTILTAGSAVVSASAHSRRDQQAAQQAQIKAAINTYAELLTSVASELNAGGNGPSDGSIKNGMDTFMGLMDSFKQLQQPTAGNSTSFKPNWEGAAIGALVAVPFGILSGGLLGSMTSWSFVGTEQALTNALGFDPIAALLGTPPVGGTGMAGGMPKAPSAPSGSTPPPSAKTAAPAPGMGGMAGMGHSHGGA
ncbi:hypothetical protein EJ08DRAFT_664519 [Tothia fuscella]|uniref:Uncharacterized protein n=1 Tax=Tothia fuscella TaxID=1048955 RepID=A0A9P4NIQ0_9PEZI|nr:hypothetical protein EJ08DRAFT_664519 [Tothia fuscella]